MSESATPGLRLLVPVDGSPLSNHALDVAAVLRPAHITVMRVITDEFLGIPGTVIPPRDEEYAPLFTELADLVRPFEERGFEIETAVVFGDAAEEIIEAAQASDLIVMTTRGQGAAGRALFGSVADRVSRHATTPTLLVRSQPGTPVNEPHRIVVPLDGSPRAETALDVATKLARTLGITIYLVRVVGLDEVRATISAARREGPDGPDIGDTFDDARVATEEQALGYLEAVATPLRDQGLTVASEVLQGTAAFVLIWNTNAEDLVVMTSHGRSGFRRWLLGSVSEKLVREGEAPLVLVPTREVEA